MQLDTVLVVDFGSQYNQLIVRRLRDLGVYSELVSRHDILYHIMHNHNLKGIILSGGPKSVYDDDGFSVDMQIFDSNIPILGICYGMQLIAHLHHGLVKNCEQREYGKQEISISDTNSELFAHTPVLQTVFMSHGDQVIEINSDFKMVASSNTCKYVAFENANKKLYGIQFHPEVTHTEFGTAILSNFIFNICHANKCFKITNYKQILIDQIRLEVKDKKVLLGLSGGVDSSVTAALLHEAIGDQLVCMFIDHGLLRKNEVDEVMNAMHNKLHIKVIKIDVAELFLSKLKGISDPEQKRKIIGNEFIYCFERECNKLGTFDYLAQGTLYTDIIESGSATAMTIKSHHNVNGLPKDMHFKLIEPLKTLFKDEVRALGTSLGLDASIVYRQPFPGPGLAIRIIGDITLNKLRIVQDSDFILRQEIMKYPELKIWQYFTVLTNIKSVGVMGDQRTYAYAVAIRAVNSVDGMTASVAHIPYDVLETISKRIVNEVKGVNRVLYDITSKPPSTIEFE